MLAMMPTVAAVDSYAAFISYRHDDLDRRWAEWLHEALEAYRVPARVRRAKLLPSRVGRVFRDEEELAASSDLSADIVSALKRSRFLVVICSPRTPGSRWVAEEIERFRAMGRGRYVLALLVEGEPGDSFPPVLQSLHAQLDGASATGLEPLAADVRPVTYVRERERKRLALLRLLAPILSVSFDELRQRDQERQRQRWVAVGALALGVMTLVSVLALVAYVQRNEATRQRDAAVQNLARAYVAAGATARADRDVLGAEVAYAKALLVHDDPETRELLLQARAQGFSLRWQVPGTGGIARAALSVDGRRIALAKAHEVEVRDLVSMERVAALATEGRPNAVGFDSTGNLLATGDDQGRFSVWDIASGKHVMQVSAHDTTIDAVAFDAASGEWRTAGRDNRIKGWKANGTSAWARGVEGPALSRALFLPGGIEVAIGNIGGQVRIESVVGGNARTVIAAHNAAIGAIALSSDGTRLATWADLPRQGAAPDPSVKVWTISSPQAPPMILAGNPGAPRADALAFSADGLLLLTGQIANGLTVWNLASGKRISTLASEDGAAFVSASGSSEAISAGPGVRRWNLAQGTHQALAAGHMHSAQALVASPDGRTITSAGFDRMLRVWNSTDGARRAAWPAGEVLHDVQVSPDGRWIATCGKNVVLRDATTGAVQWAVPLGALPSRGCLAFDPEAPTVHMTTGTSAVVSRAITDGAETGRLMLPTTGARPGRLAASVGKLAVTSSDGTILLFDLSSRTLAATLRAPGTEGIGSLTLSHDGSQLAASSRDAVLLWKTSEPDAPRVARAPARSGSILDIHSIAFTRDGLRLVATAWGEIALWDTVALRRLAVVRPRGTEGEHVNDATIAPDGRSVTVGLDDGTVASWTLEDSVEVRTLRGEQGQMLNWSASPDGTRLAAIDAPMSGTGRARVLLFDVSPTGPAHAQAAIDPPAGLFADVAFDAAGDRLFVAFRLEGDTGELRSWNLASRTWREEAAMLPAAPVALAAAAESGRLALGMGGDSQGDAVERVWILDADKLKVHFRGKGHQRRIESLRFDSKGSLWSGGLDYRAIEWRADGSSHPLPLHGGTVTSIAASPDGRWRASASRDGSVRVFDTKGHLAEQWYSHRSGYGWAEAVDFSPDGRWLATAGGDGRVLLRDVGFGWQTRFVLRGHEDLWIQSARFIGDGHRLVSRSHEGWLKIWDTAAVERFWEAPPSELAADTARRSGRLVTIER